MGYGAGYGVWVLDTGDGHWYWAWGIHTGTGHGILILGTDNVTWIWCWGLDLVLGTGTKHWWRYWESALGVGPGTGQGVLVLGSGPAPGDSHCSQCWILVLGTGTGALALGLVQVWCWAEHDRCVFARRGMAPAIDPATRVPVPSHHLESLRGPGTALACSVGDPETLQLKAPNLSPFPGHQTGRT